MDWKSCESCGVTFRKLADKPCCNCDGVYSEWRPKKWWQKIFRK